MPRDYAGELDSLLLALRHSDGVSLGMHSTRASVLETGLTLEQAIDEILAVSVSRTASAAARLRADVYWRLPIPVRVSLLNDLLEQRDMTDLFPTLCPVVRKFFDLRHLLAHGLVEIDRTKFVLVVHSVKRGRAARAEVVPAEVDWLLNAAWRAQAHLARVWAGVVPDSEEWHEN